MSAEYMHIGIPVLNKKPGMVYNEWGRFWVNESVDEYDYKIEYLKFDEGTRFPEILSKQPHVAYKVDDMTPYIAAAQRVNGGFNDVRRRRKIRFADSEADDVRHAERPVEHLTDRGVCDGFCNV